MRRPRRRVEHGHVRGWTWLARFVTARQSACAFRMRGLREAPMTSAERSNLVLAFARVLYVNAQATEQTVAAAEQLGRTLGLSVKVMPRWGELQLQSEDENGKLISQVAADPTGVDMDRAASAARAMGELGAGRLAPDAAAEAIAAISPAPAAPTW